MKKVLSAILAAFALLSCGSKDPGAEEPKAIADPFDITVELLNPTSVLLTWSHDGEGVEGWYLFLRGENEPEGIQPVNASEPLNAQERAYIFRDLEQGKSYYFGVRPKTAEGGMQTVYSEPFAMPEPEPEPEKPVTHKRKAVFIGDSITRLWPETDAAFFNRNGYIGKGIMLYNRAVELQEQAASEMDDAKYVKLVSEFEESLKGCIEPFEKAFEVSKDENVKASICQYLKNACFRFREDSVYQAKYDKYNGYLNQ